MPGRARSERTGCNRSRRRQGSGHRACHRLRSLASPGQLPNHCFERCTCSALSVIYPDAGAWEEYRIYRRNPRPCPGGHSGDRQEPRRHLVAGMGDALPTWFEAGSAPTQVRESARGGGSTRSALALAELFNKTLLADGVAAIHVFEFRALSTRRSADSAQQLAKRRKILCNHGIILIILLACTEQFAERANSGRKSKSH